MTAKNQSLGIILLVATTLLLVPLVAMQFTNEVSWSASDFLVAGVLFYGTGFLIELAIRIKKRHVRFLMIFGILLVLFLVWAELAVGVFGTPFAGS